MTRGFFKAGLNQTATYWQYGGSDKFGKRVLFSPVTISCRWENKNVLFIGPDNKEHLSNAIVYCETDLTVNGYIGEGDLTAYSNPSTLPAAKRIQQVNRSPSLDGSCNVIKVLV